MIDLPGEESPRMSKCVNCLFAVPRDEYLRQDLLCGDCYADFVRKISEIESDPMD